MLGTLSCCFLALASAGGTDSNSERRARSLARLPERPSLGIVGVALRCAPVELPRGPKRVNAPRSTSVLGPSSRRRHCSPSAVLPVGDVVAPAHLQGRPRMRHWRDPRSVGQDVRLAALSAIDTGGGEGVSGAGERRCAWGLDEARRPPLRTARVVGALPFMCLGGRGDAIRAPVVRRYAARLASRVRGGLRGPCPTEVSCSGSLVCAVVLSRQAPRHGQHADLSARVVGAPHRLMFRSLRGSPPNPLGPRCVCVWSARARHRSQAAILAKLGVFGRNAMTPPRKPNMWWLLIRQAARPVGRARQGSAAARVAQDDPPPRAARRLGAHPERRTKSQTRRFGRPPRFSVGLRRRLVV